MNPVQRALWYVESHLRMPITLDQVSAASGVSPFHLTRAFSANFGVSLMRYVRQRRLSEAAKLLASGATDILSLALDVGYGSHEAFSRAFKAEFQVTPEQLRHQAHVQDLQLTEPIPMTTAPTPKLQKPRVQTLPLQRMAGIVERYDCKAPGGIPGQWERFQPFLSNLATRARPDAFGVCFNFDDDGKFDYMTGVEVTGHGAIPFGLVEMSLPAQKYAVFAHQGHIAEIRGVIAAIWSVGLAAAALEAVPGPLLEKYGPEFDPATGLGGYEIWVAVK